MSPRFTDLSGKTFGRLTALSFTGVRGTGKSSGRYWLCVCICGETATIKASSLTQGHTQSCGCLRLDKVREAIGAHGQCQTPEYRAWRAMKQRCLNPRDQGYANYGGRGIGTCQRWDSFVLFLEDMGPRPSRLHSLERLSNNGNYEPSNCAWATKKEQCNNQRRSRRIEFNGVIKTLAEWSDATGLNYGTLRKRLRNHWPVEAMLTTPADMRFSTR